MATEARGRCRGFLKSLPDRNDMAPEGLTTATDFKSSVSVVTKLAYGHRKARLPDVTFGQKRRGDQRLNHHNGLQVGRLSREECRESPPRPLGGGEVA